MLLPLFEVIHWISQALYNFKYGAWGEVVSGNSAADATPFGFTGRWGGYRDGRVNRVLNWNRWYGPATGRWTCKDPIGIRGGANLYSYVFNSVMAGIDPNGLDPWVSYGGSASTHIGVPGVNGGTQLMTNLKTGETCVTVNICFRVGVGFFFGAGAQVGLTVGGPECGSGLNGDAAGAGLEFGAPGAGGFGGNFGVGSGTLAGFGFSVGLGVRPGSSAGGSVGVESCQTKVLKCKNSPKKCKEKSCKD